VTALAVGAAPAAPAAPVESGPYKFLDFYEEPDQSIFAGRDRDIREVVARIATNRTFVLYAASGLGKTSLLLAGVFPKLRERQFTPVYVRTLEDPMADLCAAVSRELHTGPIATLDALSEAIEQHGATTVIVLDQFEEFFIHFRHLPQKRAEFIRSIATLARNAALKLRIVFSLREDYVAELDGFRDEVSDLFTNDYRLRPLTAFGARQAIAQPLIVMGVDYDRRLLVRLVDLLADVGFDPVMLQILCTEVYRQAVARAGSEARAHARIAETDLEHAGELDGVVRRYLDRVLRAVPQGSVLLSRTMLDAMITREKTKRAVTFEMLKNADFSASGEEMERVLATFVLHRLVRAEQRGRQTWYELSHERLVQPVDDWLKLDRDFFNFRVARDLVANTFSGEVWRENYETLLSDGQLTHVIKPYERRLRFPTGQLELLCRSAIFRRVDPSHWIAQLGDEASIRILLEFMQSPNEQARSAAALAAVRCPDANGRLGDRLLELAMTDPSKAVQRAAGRSLATHATDAHLTAIRQALGSRKTLRPALSVVTDLRQGGSRALEQCGLWRVLARVLAHRRVRQEQAESIRSRGRFGILNGLLAGLGWALTVGLLTGVLATRAVGVPELIPGIVLGMLAAGFTLGPFLGWRIGRAGALDAAHNGEGRWFHAVMRLRFLFVITLVIVIWGGLVALSNGLSAESLNTFWWVMAGLMLGGVVVLALIGATVRIARASVWPEVSTRTVAFWSLCASAGLPLLLTALAVSVGIRLGGLTEEWEVVALVFAGFASVATAVALVTLARTAPPGPTHAATLRQRRVSRVWSLGLVGGVLLWFSVTYGFDHLPFIAQAVTVEGDTALELRADLRPKLSSASYFRLVVAGPEPQWLEVTEESTHTETVLGESRLGRGNVIYLPEGRHQVIMRGRVETPSTDRVLIQRLPALGPSDPLTLDSEPSVAVVAFARENGSKQWLATISGTARLPLADRIFVRFTMADNLPADGVRRAQIRFAGLSGQLSSNVRFGGPPVVVGGSGYGYSPYDPGFVNVPAELSDGSWRAELTLEFEEEPTPESQTLLIPFRIELTTGSAAY
jgi:hypothetical protein